MEKDAISSAWASKVLAIARLSNESMINIFYTPTGFFGRSYHPGKDSRSRKHREVFKPTSSTCRPPLGCRKSPNFLPWR
jgi:hypothetical protein